MAIMICIVLVVAGVSVYNYLDARDWENVTSESRNNVIFEHRNKKYGAFHLRRDYNDTFGIIVGVFILFISLASILHASIRTVPLPVEIPKMDTTLLMIIAPPMEEIETIETPYKIGGGGSGTPSDAPIDLRPKPQIKKADVIEKSDEKTKAGQGNKNTGENPNNKATSSVPSKNPFGTGGTGGGDQQGRGKGFGNDVGNGTGNGPDGDGSGGKKRVRLNDPDVTDIQSSVSCTVHLKLTINAEGTVMRAENISGKTTTTNSTVINKVISAVKSQVKYTKSEGAAPQIMYLTVNVTAT